MTSFRAMTAPVNVTTISTHERFSSLPKTLPGAQAQAAVALAALRPASARNLQLAQQLERKLAAQPLQRARRGQNRQGVAALGTRLGFGARGRGRGRGVREARPVIERLGVTARLGRGRGRRGGAIANGLRRRSNSVQSLNGRQSRSRSRSRSRVRTDRSLSRTRQDSGPARGRSRMRMDEVQSVTRGRSRSRSFGPATDGVPRRGRSRSRGGTAASGRGGRARGRGAVGARSRSRTRSQLQTRGGGVTARGRGRGRSATRASIQGTRGRGRGRGRGRAPPSKEALDKQLDQYMASSSGDNIFKTD